MGSSTKITIVLLVFRSKRFVSYELKAHISIIDRLQLDLLDLDKNPAIYLLLTCALSGLCVFLPCTNIYDRVKY